MTEQEEQSSRHLPAGGRTREDKILHPRYKRVRHEGRDSDFHGVKYRLPAFSE